MSSLGAMLVDIGCKLRLFAVICEELNDFCKSPSLAQRHCDGRMLVIPSGLDKAKSFVYLSMWSGTVPDLLAERLTDRLNCLSSRKIDRWNHEYPVFSPTISATALVLKDRYY